MRILLNVYSSITLKVALQSLLLVFLAIPELVTAQNAYARKGLLDLRQWNFEEGAVNLTGEWEFYMSELVDPAKFAEGRNSRPEYIEFPSTWNSLSQSLNPGEGYATYRLKILVRKTEQTLGFELPHFYSSYTLWLNGVELASNGVVGTSEKTSKPQWLPKTVLFNPDSDTLDIVIQASNFHHVNGGVRKDILLGESESLLFKRKVAVASNTSRFVVLVVISVVFFGLFLFSKKERSLLWFAALCLTWAIRTVFSNLYLATSLFPEIAWEPSVKIEYITLYLSMVWAILFLSEIFKSEVNDTFKYFMCICNGAFVLITLIFNSNVYTQFLPVYLSFVTLLLLYVVYVLTRAMINERQGVWLLISCVFLGVVLFAYDLIAYQGFATFNPLMINAGYICIFSLITISLLLQTGYLKRSSSYSDMLTYDELFGKQKEAKH